jgi:CCR4-NOT transcriptional regulation complex NOT5 subunit
MRLKLPTRAPQLKKLKPARRMRKSLIAQEDVQDVDVLVTNQKSVSSQLPALDVGRKGMCLEPALNLCLGIT